MYQKHQLQLVSPSFSYSAFFQFASKVEVLILLFTFFQVYAVVSLDSKVHNFASFLFFFFLLLLQGLVVWPRIGDPFVSQNPKGVCASHSPGHILGCAYTICLHGQVSISCTIPSGSFCPPDPV